MWAGMCDRDGIGLDDASGFDRGQRVKVFGGKLRVGVVDRLRNWDHVGQACVWYGGMALVVLHVSELLKNIGDRQRLKISRVGFASAVDQVTLATRAVGAGLT